MTRATLGLAIVLLLAPSTDYHVFNGLPLSTLAEAAALVLLIPFVASRALRRLGDRALRRLPAAYRRALFGAAMLALLGKLVLFASGTHAGFLACYRSPMAPPTVGPCERSYENPVFRFAVTRLDRRIDFRPADWNLSFVNSLRFNYYPDRPGPARRDRIPLAATWRADIERRRASETRIVYVGEGMVGVDGVTALTLAPSYDHPATQTLVVPAGRHAVAIAYTFDDGSPPGGPPSRRPYATFRWLEGREGSATSMPVAARRPAWGWRMVALAVDVLAGLFALLPLALYVPLLRPDWWMLGLVAVAGPGAYWLRTSGGWLPRGPGFLVLSLVVLGWLLSRNRPRRLLGAYFATSYLALLTALRTFPSLGRVVIRTAGDDWLVYESHARSILETWSLEGTHPLFRIYQPGFRYIRFIERLLFGDGEPLVAAFALGALGWAFLWLTTRLRRGCRPSATGRVVFAATGALLVGLASSATVAAFVEAPLSEYPTWICLALAVPLLFVSRSGRHWIEGAALLGASLFIRANHAPAVLAAFLLFVVRAWRLRPRHAALAAGMFAAVALLPVAQNRYYGGRWELLSTGASLPNNLVLPPARLLAIAHDGEARAILWAQLSACFAFLGVREPFLRLVLHGLQVAWLLTAVRLLAIPRAGSPIARCLLAMPLLYLGVHVFYAVLVYYPRHILIAYVAMGAVTLYGARTEARAGAAGP